MYIFSLEVKLTRSFTVELNYVPLIKAKENENFHHHKELYFSMQVPRDLVLRLTSFRQTKNGIARNLKIV